MQTEDVMRMNQYQSVISIPKKKGKSGVVNYMFPEDVRLILKQPDLKKTSGRRDMVLLSLMYNSGARVQEMADIVRQYISDFGLDGNWLKNYTRTNNSRGWHCMYPT